MNKTIDIILGFTGTICLIIGAVKFIIEPLTFWINNPELSQMQVFIATFDDSLIGFCVGIIGLYLVNKYGSNS